MPEKTEKTCDDCGRKASAMFEADFVMSEHCFCLQCRDSLSAAHGFVKKKLGYDLRMALMARGAAPRLWKMVLWDGVTVFGESPREAFVEAAWSVRGKSSIFASAASIWAGKDMAEMQCAQANFDWLQDTVSGIIEALGVELEYA